MEKIKTIRQKKICFLEGDISRSGGTERVTINIANELSKIKNKYEIHILSICKKNKNDFFEISDDIITNIIFESSAFNAKKDYFKIMYGIRKYLKQNKIDILIDVDTILDMFSIPATRFINTKFISWEHFNFYENLGVKYRDWGRMLSARYADAIVTITEEDKGYFNENLKLKCPIYHIYNPIPSVQSENRYDIDSRTILSAGRLTHQKGFDFLVDVASVVFERHPDWQWVVLGDGEDRELIHREITTHNLEENVILKGNVSNMKRYYEQSSMFVLTSRFEGFGLVLTEAKSHYLPCISFRCKAGPSEIILNGQNGYLVDCFNVYEMADKICTLIEDSNIRSFFSKNALCDTDKFYVSNIIQQWENLLDHV